jgi:PadR family transcriptional regulator PadR
MSEEKRQEEPETRERRLREAEARPRNFLVPVILVTLREWNSYGCELME